MNIIVAAFENWGIGRNGSQQLVIPADRMYFRNLTNGALLIAGRKTFEDFPGGKPLPGRQNLVLSGNKLLEIDGATVVNSLESLFEELYRSNAQKIFVAGGGNVYRLLLPYCTRAYVTKINISPPSDTFFPNLDSTPGWMSVRKGEPQDFNGISYSFDIYENSSARRFSAPV